MRRSADGRKVPCCSPHIPCKDRKYLLELIDLYEEQLQEAVDDLKFSVKNIIKPLADLYKEYGDYNKELSCRQQIAAFYKEMLGAEYA
ncbi:MAG: hypothetical protein JRE64_03790, partial [Deltaproteobacteria bacterium]|nr:hypothetical protein [Deltaproteobacteria bacterium]